MSIFPISERLARFGELQLVHQPESCVNFRLIGKKNRPSGRVSRRRLRRPRPEAQRRNRNQAPHGPLREMREEIPHVSILDADCAKRAGNGCGLYLWPTGNLSCDVRIHSPCRQEGEGSRIAGTKVLAGWVERAYEPDSSDPSSPLRISQPTVATMLTASMGCLNGAL